MPIDQDQQIINDNKRQLKVFIWVLSFVTILVIINIIDKGFDWNEFLIRPSSIITFLICTTPFIPLIYSKIKFQYHKLILSYSVFFGKLPNFEQWNDYRRNYSLNNQDDILEYYKFLREFIEDENAIHRVIDLQFQKFDPTDYVICGLGLPHFIIHHNLWRYYEKDIFYYFPYYNKKSLLNFFKIKFKFVFVIEHGRITNLKVDGIDQF